MNLLRVLIIAICYRPLRDRYPSMFDGKRALAEINAAIAAIAADTENA